MTSFAVVGSGEAARRLHHVGRYARGVEIRSVDAPLDYFLPSTDGADTQTSFDAVVICTPVEQKAAAAAEAARSGNHVVIESPLAASTDQVSALAAACNDAGVSLTVLETQRNRPLLAAIKSSIAAGAVGSPRYVHLTSIWHLPAEEIGVGDDRTFVLEHATGAIDIALWLMGEPAESIFARACTGDAAEEAVRYVSIIIAFPGGAQAVCEIGRTGAIAPQTGLQCVTVIGTGGSAHHDLRKHDVVVGPGGMRPLGDDTVEGTAAALAAWSRGGNSGALEEATVALHWALAAAESLESGLPVGKVAR